jgi:hypothetical protein
MQEFDIDMLSELLAEHRISLSVVELTQQLVVGTEFLFTRPGAV